MTAFNDWGTLPDGISETIARSRLLEMARKGLGIGRSLPESAAIDAAIVEALATANNGPPVVADDASLAARFPAPLNDQLAQVKATGYYKRWDQVLARWVAESLTRAKGPVRNPLADGAYGDGVRDDTTYIQATDAGQATSGVAELDPGTYFLNTPGTINLLGHWKPKRGALYKIGANTILNFQFPPEAGAYQIFDTSLVSPTGGYVTFSGQAPVLDPRWWGVKGDGATDDSQANQACWNACSDKSGKVRYALGMQMKHKYLAALMFRTGVELEADGFPGDGFFNDQSATFVEDKTGPIAGKILIGVYNCGYVRFKGFQFQCSGVALDIDALSVGSVAGSPNITTDGGGTGTGPAILNLLKPGSIVRTKGVTTTIQSASDGTHGVMAANATYTGGLGNGWGLTIGIGAPDPSPRISTWVITERCTFLGFAGAAGFVGKRISQTAGGNVDFNIGIDCVYSGNAHSYQSFQIWQNGYSFGRAAFNVANARGNIPAGYLSPGGTIGLLSNAFSVTNQTFVPAITVAAPGAGIGAGSIPVTALAAGIPNGAQLIFQSGIVLFTAGITAAGATAINVNNLTQAILAGDVCLGMEGARFRGEGMGTAGQGPNGLFGALDAAYMHVVDDKHVTFWTDAGMGTPVQATRAVNLGVLGHEPEFFIGQALGTGVIISSQNSHHNKEYRPQFVACGIGLKMNAGSFTVMDAWSTACTLALYVGISGSLPCRVFNWNSENDEQHLFLQTQVPFSEENGRHYMSYCTPSDGFYKILATGAARFRLEETRVEGKVPYSCAVFNLAQATSCIIRAEGNQFFDAFTLTEMGWNAALPLGGVIYGQDNEFSSPDNVTLPLDPEFVLTSGTTQANGVPVRRLGNRVYVRLPNNPVSDSTLRGAEGYFLLENNAPKFRFEDGSGNFDTLGFTVCDSESPADPGAAGTFAIDIKKLAHLCAIGTTAGNRTMGAPISTPVPRFAVFQVFNGAGGPITGLTQWNPAWHLASAWVDPAAAKGRWILFFVMSGVGYEIGRSSGDVS